MKRGLAGILLAMLSLIAMAYAADAPPEPDGYRTDNYRAPVPATLKGARVLTTRDAEALWRARSAVFVDVLPHPPKPANLPPDTVWRDKPRQNIPGSIWLPDTGYGELANVTENYLRSGLAHATQADRTKLLVFYCQANCWMSWNAAKRAMSMGYAHVAWFPDGTDGWQKADLPMTEAQPEPH